MQKLSGKFEMVKAVLLYAVVIVGAIGLGAAAGPMLRKWMHTDGETPVVATGDFQEIYRAAGAPVVLFSTSTCPFCAKAKALLTQQGVRYRDYVLDQSTEGEALYESLNEKSVPILLAGNQKIRGFDPDAIRQALRVAGSSPAPREAGTRKVSKH